MHPDVQETTSFMTERGIYYYEDMSFELKNARGTYQQLFKKMLKE